MKYNNLNRIKSKRSYNPTEISSLLAVGRDTVRHWLKQEGLRVVEKDVSPLLVMGADLTEFIKNKRLRRKIPIKENEFFCLKCRRPVKPKKESVQIIKTGKKTGKDNHELIRLKAICGVCGKKINKFSGVSQWD